MSINLCGKRYLPGATGSGLTGSASGDFESLPSTLQSMNRRWESVCGKASAWQNQLQVKS